MNANKIIKFSSQSYICFSALSLAYVAILSFYSPQATMDLVATKLPNNDAISSIRGIYGGVGLIITFQLVYLLINDFKKALTFLSLFWGAYAISRIATIFIEGSLGSFGTQWLIIESIFSLLGMFLLIIGKKVN